jgi:hypothetical protein
MFEAYAFYWCELQEMIDESHIVTNYHERVLGVRGQTRGRTFS